MGAFQTMLSAGIATLAVGGGSLAQTVSGPSMEDLLKADNDSANWILPAHNYSANRQVEESEIGPQSVDIQASGQRSRGDRPDRLGWDGLRHLGTR